MLRAECRGNTFSGLGIDQAGFYGRTSDVVTKEIHGRGRIMVLFSVNHTNILNSGIIANSPTAGIFPEAGLLQPSGVPDLPADNPGDRRPHGPAAAR
jgi:hypothetical protein